MKTKVLVTLVLLLIGSTAAATIPDSGELEQIKNEYNQQSSEVPSFVGTIVGGEKVNFKLEANNTNETVGVSFDGVEIANITRDGFDEPTLEVWSDQQTVTTVIESDSKYETLREKLDENEIQYEAKSTKSSIMVTIFDTLNGLADMIGLEL